MLSLLAGWLESVLLGHLGSCELNQASRWRVAADSQLGLLIIGGKAKCANFQKVT